MTTALLLALLALPWQDAPPPGNDPAAVDPAPGAAADDTGEDDVVDPLAPTDALELSLQQAIAECLRNNLALQGANLQTDASVAGFNATWGQFDSEWFVTVLRSETVQAPAPVTFAGGVNVGASPTTEFDLLNVRSGFRGQLETGATWEFGVGPTKAQTTVRSFSTFVEDPPGSGNLTKVQVPTNRAENITADWSFALTQPLLRGGADGFPKSGLELAAKDVSLAAVASQTLAYTTLVEVVRSYWNLVFTRQNVATVQLSVDLANELLEITRRKFQQGIQNRIDIIEVEADLARREEELLTARNAVRQAVDDLHELVFAPETADDWSRDIIPTTEYVETPAGYEVDTEAAIFDALALRPDVIDARIALERADIEVRRAENQTRPRFDVTGEYGLNSNETNTGKALRSLDDSGLHEIRVFLDLAVPIGNRDAEYTLRRRKIERERASVTLRESEVTVVGEVRSAARDVRLQLQRVRATAETTRLRQEVYDGERRRLENDLSTPFQVREAQRDYLTAVDEETRAQLDLAIAHTSLLAARGRLLEYFGYRPQVPEVDLEDAPPSL